MDEKLVRLWGFGVTRGMQEEDLQHLVELLDEKKVEAGAVLCAEDGEPPGLLLITAGRVSVRKKGEDGKQRELLSLASPTVIGELEFLDNTPVSASVVATTPLTVLTLSTDSYEELTDSHPRIAARLQRNIARVLARRLHATNAELARRINLSQNGDLQEALTNIASRWDFV